MIATWLPGDTPLARLRTKGVYVARNETKDYFTLGKADRSTIADRLKRHAVRYEGPEYEHDRHRFHPFTRLVFGISLPDASPIDIQLAECALYAAVAVRYQFVSTSVFAAPRAEDLVSVREELFDFVQSYGNVARPA